MHKLVPVAAVVAAAALLSGAALLAATPARTAQPPHAAHTTAAAAVCPAVPAPSSDLPVLTSSAVVAQLQPAPTAITPWTQSFQLAGSTATVFEKTAGGLIAVGAFNRSTPWETTPQPIVVIGSDRCGLSQVLTPARQRTPTPSAPAPASTAGWVRAADLVVAHATPERLHVDVEHATISIIGADGQAEHTWPIVSGAADTPTPTGVGYLESEYVDPSQTETAGSTISLTNLHSGVMASFGGNAGELGIHLFTDSTGGSHGCIRLPSIDAANTIGRLPTGTPVIVA